MQSAPESAQPMQPIVTQSSQPMQPTVMQSAQPMQPIVMQSAQPMNLEQVSVGTANVPVQDVLKMTETMRKLQATTRGLEQQLQQTQSEASWAQQAAQNEHARSDAAEAK